LSHCLHIVALNRSAWLLAWLPSPSEPYEVLGVKAHAPWADVESRYRQLAWLYHPDTGGNVVTMQELNAAYAAIKKERGL
jgi:DnaJ-class molecular chaperone